MGIKYLKDLEVTDFIILRETSLVMTRPIGDDDVEKMRGSLCIDSFCSEAKDDKTTPFLTFGSGCGNFVTSEWINKDDYPFPYAEKFMTKDACVNEIEIIKLWKHVNHIYSFLLKGS